MNTNTTLVEIETSVKEQLIRDYKDHEFTTVVDMLYMGLSEEVGEVLGLRKRQLRNFPKDKERVTQEKFIEELGDVLWYLIGCCISNNITLEELWAYNTEKLERRYGCNEHKS